jgi:HSP20 family protein
MPEMNVERRRQQPESGGLIQRNRSGWSDWPSGFPNMNPFAMARRMFDEMDRSIGRISENRGELSDGWMPSVEVVGQDGNMVVRADLPGIKKEDLKVEVTEGDLVIQGERRQEQEENRRGFYRSERSYGSFCRMIPLPEGANTEQAKAQFNNGVLEVSIPVPAGAMKGRQIPIETSEKK